MIDYQRGEILAYVGSANYYETRKVNRRIQPQYDVLRLGWRQPGSAFKPLNYATGIDARHRTFVEIALGHLRPARLDHRLEADRDEASGLALLHHGGAGRRIAR